jgi:hypothetical protein
VEVRSGLQFKLKEKKELLEENIHNLSHLLASPRDKEK